MPYESQLQSRKKDRPLRNEEESMRKFYEPIESKQQILNRWLRQPQR